MCLYPKLITNKKYTETKKNGGNIPAVFDERVKQVAIGCGKCMECMKKKMREWQVRLGEEIRENTNGKFVTMTFKNESIQELAKEVNKGEVKLKGYELDNEIATLAVRRFLERWRKKYKKSVRHWLITELGQTNTEHLHLHGIIWTDKTMEEIEERWQYGWMWKGKEKSSGEIQNYVNEKTVNYIIKYVTKVDEKHKEYKPKILTSQGIGRIYLKGRGKERNIYKGKNTIESYKTNTGQEIPMPIYYRNNIYTEEEREKLWINLLDKEIRYVGGNEIDISKGEEEYYKALEWYREKNKRLGYGDDKINWNRKQYENKRRELKHKERGIEETKRVAPQALRGLGTAPESAESVNSSLRSLRAEESLPDWVREKSKAMLPNENFDNEENNENY